MKNKQRSLDLNPRPWAWVKAPMRYDALTISATTARFILVISLFHFLSPSYSPMIITLHKNGNKHHHLTIWSLERISIWQGFHNQRLAMCFSIVLLYINYHCFFHPSASLHLFLHPSLLGLSITTASTSQYGGHLCS